MTNQQLPSVAKIDQADADRGKLSEQQAELVRLVLEGVDDDEASERAGYKSKAGFSAALRSVPVQTALLEARKAQLAGSLAQSALQAISELVTSGSTPAATRFAASKWVLELAGHGKDDDAGQSDKPLAEMTASELEAFMHRAQATIDRGGSPPVIAVVPDNGA